jgi:hypothetical protein
MANIILSCGHGVNDYEDSITCEISSYDRLNERCIVCGVYCKSCYEIYSAEGLIINTDEEAQKWLSGE